MERYVWTKGIFKNQLEITHGSERIGSIVWERLIGAKAHALINGRRFFLNREFFLSKLEIYDANTDALLGSIMINLFNPKSDIIINGKRFELEIKNFWQSRWSWKFNGDELITYQSHEFLSKEKGTIEVFYCQYRGNRNPSAPWSVRPKSVYLIYADALHPATDRNLLVQSTLL